MANVPERELLPKFNIINNGRQTMINISAEMRSIIQRLNETISAIELSDGDLTVDFQNLIVILRNELAQRHQAGWTLG